MSQALSQTPAVILLLLTANSALSQTATPSAQAIQAHAGITEYWGPWTCVSCHDEQAADVLKSVHYQWRGPTPNVINVASNAGKAGLSFNTYCGTPATSRRANCWSCHIGYGTVPSTEMSDAQLENIDCMICHQDQYKRKPTSAIERLLLTDYQGNPRSVVVPFEDAEGNFGWMPDEAAMSLSPVEAARAVHMPTRAGCLKCHAYAGGGDGTKRGDISSVTANPSLASDVHMSPQGRNFTCQSCHEFSHHQVLGRGLDLMPNDRPQAMTCTGACHSTQPHALSSTAAQLNRHCARVACQTCHIPTYAVDVSTEMSRSWTTPVWAPTMFSGQGGYKPEEIRASNVTPTYAWYDGTSVVYSLGEAPPLNTSGEYELGAPHGSVTSSGAQIFPMKEHRSNSAKHTDSGQLIPHSTSTFFLTGDFNQAVQAGMNAAGLSGDWTLVKVHNFQTINHGVRPKSSALACGKCHAALAGGPTVMNLQGSLGYGPKSPRSTLCTACHEFENSGFTSVHSRHVDRYRYDCVHCHNFTRPERNLNIPANMLDTDKDSVVDVYDNCPGKPNRDQADIDRDGKGDACDNCPSVHNTNQADTDNDTIGDACDNCPALPNTSQTDFDKDGVGDACESCQDADQDGFGDPDFAVNTCPLDNCPDNYNPEQEDEDNDGVGDWCDWCPYTPAGTPVDAVGCPVPPPGDLDLDGDADQEDFGLLQRCMTGPGIQQPDPACILARLDADNDVDVDDMAVFQKCRTAPGILVDPECRNAP